MITIKNFENLLKALEFETDGNTYKKSIGEATLFDEATLKVDFDRQEIIYPEGLKVNRDDICNLLQNENFVVFECVHRLIKKGYKPAHLELEPRWQVGHGVSGGRADILIRDQEKILCCLLNAKQRVRNLKGHGGKHYKMVTSYLVMRNKSPKHNISVFTLLTLWTIKFALIRGL